MPSGQLGTIFAWLLTLVVSHGFAFASPSATQSCPQIKESLKKLVRAQSASRLDADTLLDRTYAVHATGYLPKGGVVEAGNAPRSFRPEIHFSLGELVRSHQDGVWELMPYAVVSPLRSLEPQLASIMPYDTWILGDFKIPKDGFLVMPMVEVAKAPAGVRIFPYDSNQETLRKAVDRLIKQQRGLEMHGFDGMGAPNHPFMMDGKNINQIEFFKPLLDRNPNLSFGSHAHSFRGDAWVYGMLDIEWKDALRSFPFGAPKETARLRFHHDVGTELFAKLETMLKRGNLPDESIQTVRKKSGYVRGLYNLEAAELMVREKYGKTLYLNGQTNPARVEALKIRAHDRKSLYEYVESVQSTLDKYVDRSHLISDSEIDLLASFDPVEASALMDRNSGFFSVQVGSRAATELKVSLRKVLRAGESHESWSRLAKTINDTSARLLVDASQGEISSLKFFLDSFLFNSRSLGYFTASPDAALRVLELPKFKELLGKYYDIHLPAGLKPLTLDEVFKAHPATREAYLPYPELFYDPVVAHFLAATGNPIHPAPTRVNSDVIYQSVANQFSGKALQPKGSRDVWLPAKPPFTDYEQAFSAAYRRGNLRRDPLLLLQDLQMSPAKYRRTAGLERQTNAILFDLNASWPTNFISFWKKVGLEKEVATKFIPIEQFWNSHESILDIYRELVKQHQRVGQP